MWNQIKHNVRGGGVLKYSRFFHASFRFQGANPIGSNVEDEKCETWNVSGVKIKDLKTNGRVILSRSGPTHQFGYQITKKKSLSWLSVSQFPPMTSRWRHKKLTHAQVAIESRPTCIRAMLELRHKRPSHDRLTTVHDRLTTRHVMTWHGHESIVYCSGLSPDSVTLDSRLARQCHDRLTSGRVYTMWIYKLSILQCSLVCICGSSSANVDLPELLLEFQDVRESTSSIFDQRTRRCCVDGSPFERFSRGVWKRLKEKKWKKGSIKGKKINVGATLLATKAWAGPLRQFITRTKNWKSWTFSELH